MKTKLLFLSVFLFAMSQSFAQVHLFESFNYSPVGAGLLTVAVPTPPDPCVAATYTNPVTNTTWWNYSAGTPCFDMLIADQPTWGSVATGLSAPTGNAVAWQGGGEDGMIPFTAVSGTGKTIYLSFLIDILGWNASGSTAHFPEIYRHINLAISASGNAGSGLFIKPGTVAGTFQLGYGNSDNTAAADTVFSPTNYTYTDTSTGNTSGQQFFIVIRYTIGVSSGPDGAMWINPTISSTEPTPNLTHTAVNKIRTSFEGVVLQAGSNNRNPKNIVDEIRVAGSWEEALGLPALSVSKNELENGVSLYPNPANDYITINAKENLKVSSVEVFTLLGQKVLSQNVLKDNKINVASLSRGIYLLKIAADGNSITKKIVIE